MFDMSTHTFSVQQLETFLNDGIKQTTLLFDLLVDEYQALQHTDPDKIEITTHNKSNLLRNLELLVNSNNSLLMQMGYSTDRRGIDSFLNDLSIKNDLRNLWNDLQALLKKCQQQNEVNNGIIILSKRQINNSLDLLYGLAAGSKTYGPTGESRPNRQPNTLGKA